MSYIGQTLPADTFQGFTTDSFTGDGSATTFTLSKTPFNESALLVVINNVVQKPTTNFTVSGTTLTIVGTAVASSDVIYATHIGGALPIGQAASLDLNGASDQLILDADADTTISADTDDQIDVKIGGSDIATLTTSSLTLKNSATADNSTFTLNLQTAESDIAADDVIGKIAFAAPNEGTGTDANLTAAAVQAVSEGDFSASSNASSLVFMTGSSAAAAERARINSAGHLSVGATSITNGGGYNKVIQVSGTEGCFSAISSGGEGLFAQNGDNTQIVNRVNGYMQFRTNNTERVRIESAGQVHVLRSGGGTFFDATHKIVGELPGDSYAFSATQNMTAGSGPHYFAKFFSNGQSLIGSITTSNTGTAFNTSSDYRLKENVDYTWDATTRLKQLKPARFNFISDADTTVDGFLAHEVSSIVPEAISGEKDATETRTKVVLDASGNQLARNVEESDWTAGKVADEEGNTKYPSDSTWVASKVYPKHQAIDQSKLVPLLVKTVQELEARIKALEDA